MQQNGDCSFGGEGPHPDTDKSQMKLKNVGNLQGKTVGIKSIIWRHGAGAHQELYIDTTSLGRRWVFVGKRDIATWGNSRKSNRITETGQPQQVEFRVDCSKARWIGTSVAEINPPLGALAQTDMPADVPQIPNKIAEIENQLSYYTVPVIPRKVISQPVVKETYLAKKLGY